MSDARHCDVCGGSAPITHGFLEIKPRGGGLHYISGVTREQIDVCSFDCLKNIPPSWYPGFAKNRPIVRSA